MSHYTISNPALNPKRVFILQKSEVEKRFDPFFYSPLNRLKILEKTNLPKKKLSEVADLKRGKFSHRPRNDERFFGGEYPFIQTGEIVKASNNYGKIQFSQTLNELGLSVSKLFDTDVLLITIAANIGDTAILNYPACFPDSIVAISSKDENVSLKYLNVYFKFLKKYLENLAPSAAQKNLTLEQLAPTPVILPTIESQNQIVEIFDTYISQKQTNEAEAEKLLSSIDDYLLEELGITLPTPPENTLKNRMFIANSKDILGSRFDPRFYQNHYLEFYANLDIVYPTKKVKDLSVYIGSGSTPRAGGDDYTQDEKLGVPFIRITNLKNDTILLDDVLYIKREIHENSLKRTQLNPGDVLMSMAGTIGLTVIVPNFIIEANINQAIARIVLNSEINRIYFKEILNSIIGKKQTDRLSRPSVQANINFDEIGSLLIPVPPLAKQKEIADHITNIRNQAQALKDKTKDLLKKASEEIEEILLK